MAGGRDPLVLWGAARRGGTESGQLSQGLGPSGLAGSPSLDGALDALWAPLPPAAPRLRLPGPCLLVSLGFYLPSFSRTWVLLCGSGPPRTVWPWGPLTLSWPLRRSKVQRRSDPEGLHWASLGWAGPGAPLSGPGCSGLGSVSSASERATLEATGLWEAHVLALPPASPQRQVWPASHALRGTAGRRTQKETRAPGQERFSLPSRPVSVPGRGFSSLWFW